jgi:NAD(P)-dependent dehydrogenase (short-subunit alcohol dehydrogenase family)
MTESTKLNILVTGSSSGFGKLIAQTLAKDGHRVFASMRGVNGKNATAATMLGEWAAGQKAKLEVVELDVIDQVSVDKAVSTILDMAGHLDVVVNNAGTGNVGVLEGYTLAQVQTIFDINTFGALRVDKAVLPSMRARRSGLLIHISSTGGRVMVPFVAPYSAAKAALEAIAEEFSFELAPFGIESVIIEPGGYGTEAFSKLIVPTDDQALSDYGEMATKPQEMFASMGQMLTSPGAPDPQEVADAVKQLIGLPAGQRPLRTIVGSLVVAGVEALNRAYEASKQEMLASLGVV